MMIKINRILCPIDFSRCSEIALRNAYFLASALCCELHVFHAVIMYEDDSYKPDDRLPDNIVSYDLIEEISNQKINQIIKDHDICNAEIKTASSRGFSAVEEILNYASENEIDFIAMGTHGRTALSHLLLGSVAERIVQMSTYPVMTFRKNDQKLIQSKNILLPIDFSEYSKLALQYALELAKHFDLTITLFHAFEQDFHPAFYAAGKESIFEIDKDLKKRAERAITDFRADLGYPDVKTKVVFDEGIAYQAILKQIEAHYYDFVALGSHGLKGIEHFLMGSTAEKVVRRSEIPVLTVKKTSS